MKSSWLSLSRLWPLAGLGLLLGACTTGLTNPEIPPPGTSAFQEGYIDGCVSGYTDAGRDGYETRYQKDTQRYTSDADYRKGWNDGEAACFEEEKLHPRVKGGEGVGPRT